MAILTVGARLGITAVLRGDWSHGSTWHVRADGTTGDGHDNRGPHFNVLDSTATIDILTTVHQARPDTDELPAARVQLAGQQCVLHLVRRRDVQ